MSLTLMSNLATMMLCIGVIVQAMRMMRQLQAVKNSELGAVVTGLDKATGQAAAVLADLKRTLGTDGAALAQRLADGTELREELTMLIGIANSMAERLVEAGQAKAAGPVIDADAIEHAWPEQISEAVPIDVEKWVRELEEELT
jgi:hypothetical protein